MSDLYKLILVDDEDDIRGRILSMITEDTGFEVVGTASNGYDALELIEELTPHAVITDIRMPYIDGIQLAQEIQTDFSNVKVAFLTGFGEFDYAVKAVELDVISYLMKPVVKQDILQFLIKLKGILDTEYELINDLELFESNVHKNRQLYLEKQLNTYLMQGEIKEKDIESLDMYNITENHNQFVVGIIEFFNNSSLQDILKSETFIREFVQTSITQFDSILPFSTQEGLGLLFINEEINLREIEFAISKLLAQKNEHDNVQVRVSLSSVFDDFKDFVIKYQEASSALQLSRFTNTTTIVAYENIDKENFKQAVLTLENIREIEHTIRFADKSDIEGMFKRLTNKLTQTEHIDFQLFIISASNIILSYSMSLGIPIEHYFKNGLLNELLNLNSTEEILDFTKKTILDLREKNISNANSRNVEKADQVIEYINNLYHDSSLNMDKVADQFNVSISYLSNLLRKEKGTSLSKYLIQVRIEKAKELLKYTDLKIIEVAKRVGYNDVYYFSHSFKKNTKMSPKEYRENA